MYFFTDPAKLITQTDAQAYGPVQGNEPTKYRVTSKFRVATGGAPAIAAMGGVVLVQPHAVDPTLCNLAIKVDDRADDRTQFDKIDYIIYRGLKCSSFLDAATTTTQPYSLLPSASSNSGLVAAIWTFYTNAQADAQKLGLSAPSAPTADWLGLNRTDTAQTLEAAFGGGAGVSLLPVVKGGLSLGVFADNVDAGIEFVIFDRFYQPTIGDLRKAEMVFEVPLVATSAHGHDADYTVQRTRENILNYIDPAAYYTMHYRLGVNYKDVSGTEHHCGSASTIQSSLLTAFLPSKNRLYIDIRNELGGSLNFYRDNEGPAGFQDQHFKWAFEVGKLASDNYYTSYWPIFSIIADPSQITSNSNSPIPNNTPGKLFVQVRKAHNPKPLLFVDYGYPSSGSVTDALPAKERFTDVTDGNGSDSDWSAYLPLTLLSPSTATVHPTWFIKLMCIRQEVPANLATTAPSAPPRHYALDHVFGPFRADMLVSGGPDNVLLPGKKYMSSVNGQGGAIIQIVTTCSNSELTLRAKPLFIYEHYMVWSSMPTSLLPPNFYNSDLETKWLLQPGVVTKQVTLAGNGQPITLLREDFSLDASAINPTVSPTITLLVQQVQDYLLPSLVTFNKGRDEAYINFVNVNREQDDISVVVASNPITPFPSYQPKPVKYIAAHIELASLTQNEQYTTNPPAISIPCYTLDSITFVSIGNALNLKLPIISNANGYILAEKLVDYVKVVEKSYAAIDSNAIETATRLRVHYYGPFAHPGPNLFNIPFTGTTIAWGQGLVFNDAVKRARYYITAPQSSGSGFSNGVPIRLDDDIKQTSAGRDAYMHLVAQADENGVGDNPSPYIVLKNSAQNTTEYVDLGHALYGFEAWQLGHNGTTMPFQELKYSVRESVDFAGLIADLGPGIAEFVNRLINHDAYQSSPSYPADDNLAAFYHHSNPNADFASDADGLGMYNTYNNLPNKPDGTRPSLSQVLSVYYAATPLTKNEIPGLKNHPLASHYSRRWLTLASAYDLIRPINAAADKYTQNEFYWIGDHVSDFNDSYNKFFERVIATTNVLYNKEVNAEKTGLYLLNVIAAQDAGLLDVMNVRTKSTIYPVAESVIYSVINDLFFPDFKSKIKAENTNLVLR